MQERPLMVRWVMDRSHPVAHSMSGVVSDGAYFRCASVVGSILLGGSIELNLVPASVP